MSNKFYYFSAIVFIFAVASCSLGETNKKKFSAQEKESTMTDKERNDAIAEKRASLVEVDTAVLIGNSIKLTIMTPTPDSKSYVTEKMSADLANKLLSMASKNGISGLGGDPSFVLAAGITSMEKKLTGTVPQKTMLTYELTLYVGNITTGTIFGSSVVKLMGVGDNEKQAANNAVSEFKDSKDIQTMLVESKSKIVDYYNSHSDDIKAKVESAIAKGEFDKAYSLLYSVPSESSNIFEYAKGKLPIVCEKIFAKESSQNLVKLKIAIADSEGTFNPETGAYLAMIPSCRI